MRIEWLALGLVLTVSAWAIPAWGHDTLKRIGVIPSGLFDGRVAWEFLLLLLGLVLVLPNPRRSGLCIGRLQGRAFHVLLVCGVPPILTALVYPQLPVRPFGRFGWEMWMVSPLAQDLVFLGFLYGRLEPLFPGAVHRKLPVHTVLPVAALFFAAWHLPNLLTMAPEYVGFQLAYTWSGFVLTGLSRQWTGSLLYATVSHSAVNLIAWLTT